MTDIESAGQEPSKQTRGPEDRKVRRNRLWIIGAIAGALLVSAVAGGLTWHKDPSFCGTVCHGPMAAYSKGFSDPSQLVQKHASGAKLKCLDCHDSKIGEQLTEAARTVTGDYVVQAGYLQPKEPVQIDDSFCLGCHASKHTSRAQLIAATAKKYGAYNPHTQPHYAVPCISCHQMHGLSTNYCANCHYKAIVPAGWRPRDLRPYGGQPLVPRPAKAATFH
jgi:hypothetical protein